MKRLLDFLVAFFVLLFFSPILVVLIVTVRVALGSPVFFCQLRPGILGSPFMLYKFRTMRDAVDASGTILPDEQRMTGFGSFLRSTSLDELPSLWNVLKGEMSLVGPRPLLMEYLPLYNKVQTRRHEVRPGITGWAQVNGRNAISWDEKFNFDVWYIDNQSVGLDIKILWLTVKKVIVRVGINQDNQATAEHFKGNKNGN
jgi:lipopolysaccharide/colanic/teichoic acid biosynthesis glycosyltransferase